MSITNLTSPYSTQYQVSSDDIDLVKIRSKETSPLTHEDLDDNFANLMNKVNELVGIIGGTTAAVSVDADGNVGIGTASPNAKLEVRDVDSPKLDLVRSTVGGGVDGIELKSLGNGTTTNERSALIDLTTPNSGTEGATLKIATKNGTTTYDTLSLKNGNVGIGTASPNSALHIEGGTNSTSQIRLKNYNNTADISEFTITPIYNVNQLQIRDGSGTSLITLDGASRNVGIGNTNPSHDLTLGSATSTGTTSERLKIYRGADDAGQNLEMGFNHITVTRDFNPLASSQSTFSIKQRGSDGERTAMHVDTAGNVGIGTTSPDVSLEVKGARPAIRLNDSDPANQSNFEIVSNGGSFGIFDANNGGLGNLLHINGGGLGTVSGNVGIGTASPSSNLTVSHQDQADESSTGTGNGLEVINAQSGGRVLLNAARTSGGGSYEGDLRILNQKLEGEAYNWVENMRITSAGYVGIGTTSPNKTLEVAGNIRATKTLVDGGDIALNLNVGGGPDHPVLDIYDKDGNDGARITADGDSWLSAKGGNVGIGTMSPANNLVIRGSSNSGSTLSNDPPYMVIENSYNNYSKDYIFGGLAFTKTGSINVNGSLSSGVRAGIVAFYDQDHDYSSTQIDTNVGLGLNFRTSTQNAGDSSTRMTITGSGNVGIGTTDPVWKLDVSDTKTLILGADDTNTGSRLNATAKSSRVGGFRYNNVDRPVHMMQHISQGIDSNLYFGWGTSEMDCPTKIIFGTAPHPNTSSSQSTGNQRMLIDGDGRVGIGTTSPSSTLQVVGSLSKSSGSFRIDHPVKPETHDLVHSFVEAPQADNIYRGKVDLINGEAEVDIDAVAGMTEGTFAALNREIQVFTSNETDWSAVRGRVDGNKLIIDSKNNQSTATISWLVIGERKDKHMYDTEWTDENGKVIVEPLKPEPSPEPEISPEPEPEPYVAEDIITKDGKEYIRIGDKDYEVLGKNEDGSLLLDDDVTNNG